jgi:phosphatidylinositol glycan class M
MDDGLLLPGVRYTDIDYLVFTDAASHIAEGRSPYRRHTYRYTPFLAALLSLPMGGGRLQQASSSSYFENVVKILLSTKYFGKILFCVADAICGYIILILRARSRRSNQMVVGQQQGNDTNVYHKKKKQRISIKNLSPEFIDALWWLYNPLPINICTRGSAEALVVLLPVLVTVALTTSNTAAVVVDDEMKAQSSSSRPVKSLVTQRTIPMPLTACLAGILHGIGIHCKLYPVIYTVSFMANFSRQEQQQQQQQQHRRQSLSSPTQQHDVEQDEAGWTHSLSEQMIYFQNCMCCTTPQSILGGGGFPWKHPMKILMLGLLWMQRLFLTTSSIVFLMSSIITVVGTTYAAVYYYGYEALEEGLLYHLGRIDHRHNYSMYWYWIYLLRGSRASGSGGGGAEVIAPPSTWLGNVPLIPQILSE